MSAASRAHIADADRWPGRAGETSPYQGLEHFSEQRSAYFFGREEDVRIIIANLLTGPLTVLYGASGVGKSSVLLAGVLPHLREQPRLIPVVVRDWQSSSFRLLVRHAIVDAAREKLGVEPGAAEERLDELVLRLADQTGCELVLIFDQFEEYFRSRADADLQQPFEAELAALVNRNEVPAHVLLSLREDSLALLDRLEWRIPGILGNCIRLEHLPREAAEQAIRRPLQRYSAEHEPVAIDDALVERLLDECTIGRVGFGRRGAPADPEAASPVVLDHQSAPRIELPFLQLILMRLWQTELDKKSRRLHLSTLEALGGVAHIVSSHLDDVLEPFPAAEKRVLTTLFDRLVTPSGGKIAYSQGDLEALVAGETPGLVQRVRPVLAHLSDPAVRILRELPPAPDEAPDERRFELLHDVLGRAVLDWRQRTVASRRLQQAQRRIWLVSSTVFTLVLVALLAVTYRYYELWVETRPWGRLTSLLTGHHYPLAQDLAHIGRFTEHTRHVPLQVELRPNSISRFHLTVSKNAYATEMRSLYGTTINGEFLPYGDSRPLETDDLIVLAGTAAFRYHQISHRPWHFFWPPDPPAPEPAEGWALLIDGRSREVFPLTFKEHYVVIEPDGSVRLDAHEGPNAVLAVRQRQIAGRIHYDHLQRRMNYPQGSRCGYTDQIDLMVLREPSAAEHEQEFSGPLITIEDFPDGRPMIVDMKKGDYCYGSLVVGEGEELVALYDPVQAASHDVHGLVYAYGEARFHIIPVDRSVETEAPPQLAEVQ